VRQRQTKGSATVRLHLNHRATPRLHKLEITIGGLIMWIYFPGAQLLGAQIEAVNKRRPWRRTESRGRVPGKRMRARMSEGMLSYAQI
jgi:hypothetical protein